MKLAVPDWEGRVSPVFDVAEQIVLVDLEGRDAGPDRQSLGSTAPHERAKRLIALGVDVLVCGAISWPLEVLLAASGIRVVPLICGEVADVVQAFRDGTLGEPRFAMPGCCRRREHVGEHRRRRGGKGSASEELA